MSLQIQAVEDFPEVRVGRKRMYEDAMEILDAVEKSGKPVKMPTDSHVTGRRLMARIRYWAERRGINLEAVRTVEATGTWLYLRKKA